MICAVEQAEMSGQQLTVAKNKLEQNKVRREQVEIEDFFTDRQKRLQELEEQELEADARRRHQEAASEKRQAFFSQWLEYALRRKPYNAPDEVELDVHSEVLTTLAKLDTHERDFVIRRLVDAAVERGLKTWKTGEAKHDVIEHAIQSMPWSMKHDQAWKAQAAKITREALKDVSVGISKEEMEFLARSALQPLIREFEHAGKIEEAVNGVRVNDTNYEELREGKELVREALSGLPNTASNRQITEAKEKALVPLSARVAERIARQEAERQREEIQRQRQQVLSSISWRLPRGISEDDRETAIREIDQGLNDLPADASQRDMERILNEIVQDYQAAYEEKARRAEEKAELKARRAQEKVEQARTKAGLIHYGLNQIFPYAERLIQEFDYDHAETAWSVDSRVRSEVHKTLEEELTGEETEPEVRRIVRELMRDIEGCR
jgi:hypothetical protein